MRKASLLILFAIGLSLSTQAQHFKKKYRYWSAGGNVGISNYVGDIDPDASFLATSVKFTRANFGAFLIHRFNPRLSWRASFNWARIQGSDRENNDPGASQSEYGRYMRNLSFRNDIKELKADLIIDLFSNRRNFQRRVDFTPYFFVGIAGFLHNPRALYDGEWYKLQPLGTEGQNVDGVGRDGRYSLVQVAVPFGVGFRYKLGTLWDLAFEIGWRWTYTDYLDDVSDVYVDKYLIYDAAESGDADIAAALSDRSVEGGNGALPPESVFYGHSVIQEEAPNGVVFDYMTTDYGRTGNKRGTPSRKDWYILTGFHLSYIFHPKVVCPKFRG